MDKINFNRIRETINIVFALILVCNLVNAKENNLYLHLYSSRQVNEFITDDFRKVCLKTS
jgi:hypothetical protein